MGVRGLSDLLFCIPTVSIWTASHPNHLQVRQSPAKEGRCEQARVDDFRVEGAPRLSTCFDKSSPRPI
ncbi:hypothetical protein CGGC5_v006674 [Colletotrichum fructicola Nara gc5]|uniref:Uncharacterized protein n=1 Tax=Colletotrichum fructicola (strain Nara gc5) TaxID=1213859 RepID=A0A7J6J9W9_COLFN|nr:hypothetical protein CGGC5_v006674 [Colletotrichum fructicola Nara gc5]